MPKRNFEQKIREAVEKAGPGNRVVITRGLRIRVKSIDYIMKHKIKQHPSISNVHVY